MGSPAETSVPAPRVEKRWLWGARAAAGVSLLMLLGLAVSEPSTLFLLWPLFVGYGWVLIGLGRKRRRGAALLGRTMGLLLLLVTLLLLGFLLSRVEGLEWKVVGLLEAYALAQAVVMVSGFQLARQLPRETASTSAPLPEEARRRLARVKWRAGVSLILLSVPLLIGWLVSREPLWWIGLVALAPVWPAYLAIWVYARRTNPKKGLATAVGLGSLVFLLSLPAATGATVGAFKGDSRMVALASGLVLFALMQAAMVRSAIGAYYAIGREKGDWGKLAGALVYAAFCFAWLMMVAIAIPSLLPSRMAANESSAVGTLRIINVSAAYYEDTYKNGFPPDLRTLGPAGPGGSANCNQGDFIDAVVVSGEKSGYRFDYRPGPRVEKPGKGCPIPGVKSYTILAQPLVHDRTGIRSFFTDETGVIRMTAEDRAATAADPPL
ncbi:MAG: hypothetical protein HY656_08635 [Acidobacteria bacterium]|nr:hypothetical protein [Acidobacteriota bacterium]